MIEAYDFESFVSSETALIQTDQVLDLDLDDILESTAPENCFGDLELMNEVDQLD